MSVRSVIDNARVVAAFPVAWTGISLALLGGCFLLAARWIAPK